MDPSKALRVRLLVVSLAIGASLQATAAAQTVKLRDLPGAVKTNERATALDIMKKLVDVDGLAQIRLWYSNQGTSDFFPGQFRAIDILPPLPELDGPPPIPLFIQFKDPVADFNVNHLKRPTLKSVHINRGLAVCLITTIYVPMPTGPPGTPGGRVVSFVDPVASSLIADLPTDLLVPNSSGRAPEGAVSFTTFVSGDRNRFVVANNYHEGSVTFFDWNNLTTLNSFREVRVNNGLSTCFAKPAGNHNRGIAVAQPTMGPFANKTVVLVAVNFDPYGVDCNDPKDEDGLEDEGEDDYLVVLDVTAMDPDIHVNPHPDQCHPRTSRSGNGQRGDRPPRPEHRLRRVHDPERKHPCAVGW